MSGLLAGLGGLAGGTDAAALTAGVVPLDGLDGASWWAGVFLGAWAVLPLRSGWLVTAVGDEIRAARAVRRRRGAGRVRANVGVSTSGRVAGSRSGPKVSRWRTWAKRTK